MAESHVGPRDSDLRELIVTAWYTNSRVTAYLVEEIPRALWAARIPEIPTRSVRSIAAHLHNSRCGWIRTLGEAQQIRAPHRVDHRRVTQRQLLRALPRSAEGIAALLELGFEHGGRIPAPKTYVWRNLALDVGHVLSYFVAHEAHHRGQIVMAARQLHQRLPAAVTGGLWHWRS